MKDNRLWLHVIPMQQWIQFGARLWDGCKTAVPYTGICSALVITTIIILFVMLLRGRSDRRSLCRVTFKCLTIPYISAWILQPKHRTRYFLILYKLCDAWQTSLCLPQDQAPMTGGPTYSLHFPFPWYRAYVSLWHQAYENWGEIAHYFRRCRTKHLEHWNTWNALLKMF